MLGYIVDFCARTPKVVVEVDGPVHDRTRLYDAQRDRVLRGHGYLVLRFSNAQVQQELDAVISEISAALLSRAAVSRAGTRRQPKLAEAS